MKSIAWMRLQPLAGSRHDFQMNSYILTFVASGRLVLEADLVLDCLSAVAYQQKMIDSFLDFHYAINLKAMEMLH